jgi:hypothetical protein
VTVAGPSGADVATHAGAESGIQPEPANPSKDIPAAVEKAGRVLSSANESRIRMARDHLDECLASVATEDDSAKTATREPRLVVLRPSEPRKLTVNPESVVEAVKAEVRRLRGRLD